MASNGLILPDFAGRFNAGRDRATRNMLLQRQIEQENAALGREEQTRNLLADYTMPGASPEERAANLNRLMAVNPEAAMQAQTFANQQTTFQRQEADAARQLEREQAQTVVRRMQRVLASPNPAISLRVNGKFPNAELIDQLAEHGIIDPSDGIDDDEARRIAQLTLDHVAPLAGDLLTAAPAGVQTFEALAQAGGLTPEERARAAKVELGLEPRAAGGGLQTFRMRGGDGAERIYRFSPQSGALETFANGQWVAAAGGARPIGGEAQAMDAFRGAATDGLFEGRAPEEQATAEAFSEAETKDLLQAKNRVSAANDLVFTVEDQLAPVFDRVLDNADGWTVGLMSATGLVPGTPAANMRADLDTLGANAAFDRLQRMREQSPTGGALGAISERELDLLRSTVAAIAQSQGPAQFRSNVEQLRRHYDRIADLARSSRDMDRLRMRIASLRQRPQTRDTSRQIADLQKQLFGIEDSLWQALDKLPEPSAAPASNAGASNAGSGLPDVSQMSDEELRRLASGG